MSTEALRDLLADARDTLCAMNGQYAADLIAKIDAALSAPPAREQELASRMLSELMRGLELPPAAATSPQALYYIGRAIADQAKSAVQSAPPSAQEPAPHPGGEAVRPEWQALFDIANDIHGAFDEQSYDEKRRADFDLPDDHEYSIQITVKQERALSQAIIGIEKIAATPPTDAQPLEPLSAMTVVDKLQMLLARCKCGVFLTVNEHRDYYQSAEEALEKAAGMECPPEIDPDVRRVMVETNTIVELQFYPDTPVGSYSIWHHDVNAALGLALGTLGTPSVGDAGESR